ncbi:MFS transporter [Mycobacterium alsense]|uniref:MFS transporter n=1 Tax=Mycobacterium alsense TaxID=324058 RepID=A0AA42BZP1_9MYCO|nr:MFS transporter [Mycobacterium alsense]MCV7379359.1 MFS transporter [Mycobacterium alsense]OQZ92463.1 MFS transporter [Mycobacterium alsense]
MIALGYGVVSPVLPSFARTFGVSIGAATFVITIFSLARLCFAPASGQLVRRFGERPTYLYGLLVVALSTAACAFAHSYWQLLVFRALNGVGSTMFFVSAFGLMIRISPPDARGEVAGLFTTSFLLGAIGGPVVGSLTAGWGLGAPFIVYGVVLLGMVVVLYYSLRDSELTAPGHVTRTAVTMREALRHRAYRSALLSNFATGWSVFGLRISLVPLFVSDVMGRGVGITGLILATFAAGNALAVIPSGYVSDRVGRRRLLMVGQATSGMATIWLGAVSSLPVFLVVACVTGATAGIFMSPLQAAAADILGSEARAGSPVAAVQMMSDVGAIVGSVAVGQIAGHLTFGLGFVVSGVVLLVAAAGWARAPETRVSLEPGAEGLPPQEDVELSGDQQL